jgi:3-oxoacyl-[acyl-carrier-protein] synthase-3
MLAYGRWFFPDRGNRQLMSQTDANLASYLLSVLRGVLEDSGIEEPGALCPTVRFADVFDSMAMVEFLGVVAEDCGCEMGTIEGAVDQRFSTVQNLAEAMHSVGLAPREPGMSRSTAQSAESGAVDAPLRARTARQLARLEAQRTESVRPQTIYLIGSAVRLPCRIQHGAELDAAVGRPAGWLERRAGILQRRVWGEEDPIEAAAGCATESLRAGRVPRENLHALIVVSEAPPLAVGLAAAIHERISLPPEVPCYELGGACTGFLSALALSRSLILGGPVLIVSVEAHSQLLPLEHGPYGESAALFGDGCAAVVLDVESSDARQMRLIDLATFADGGASELIRVRPRGTGMFGLEMEGVPLTEFALHALSTATRDMVAKHSLSLSRLAAIVAHGGNGRMPAMLARLLHLPAAKVWSEVTTTGNLGSASVPVAWASRQVPGPGHVIWTAVGAGLLWGAALWEVRTDSP